MRCYKCLKKIDKKYKAGLHPHCYASWFGVEHDEDFQELTRQQSISQPQLGQNNEKMSWQTSFFAGKFRKYSAVLGGQSYILKVQQEDAPELPYVEYVCNQIAEKLGLPVAKYAFISLFDKPAFVTLNFIESQRRLAQLVHLYHYVGSADKYHCKGIISVVENEIGRRQAVEYFIRLSLYDALIGNHDRHGRNLGFVVTANRKIWSPLYDNTSYLGLEEGEFLKANFSPKGKIATTTQTEPLLKDYVHEFIQLGYEKTVKQFFNRVSIDEIEKIIQSSFCSDLMKTALSKLIKARYQEFEHALLS